MNDTRRRFLRQIADEVGVQHVVEVHVFQPMRQSGRETGVAVVAVQPPPTEVPAEAADRDSENDGRHATPPNPEPRTPNPDRLIIYRAQYRHTLKGPDRGRWEMEVVAEADAPLITVDDVVRGVHRRAGEDIAPERLTAEAFRDALVEEPWSASAR